MEELRIHIWPDPVLSRIAEPYGEEFGLDLFFNDTKRHT